MWPCPFSLKEAWDSHHKLFMGIANIFLSCKEYKGGSDFLALSRSSQSHHIALQGSLIRSTSEPLTCSPSHVPFLPFLCSFSSLLYSLRVSSSLFSHFAEPPTKQPGTDTARASPCSASLPLPGMRLGKTELPAEVRRKS